MKKLKPEFLIVIIVGIVALIAIVIMTSGAKQADLAGQAAFIKYETLDSKGLRAPDDLVASDTVMTDTGEQVALHAPDGFVVENEIYTYNSDNKFEKIGMVSADGHIKLYQHSERASKYKIYAYDANEEIKNIGIVNVDDRNVKLSIYANVVGLNPNAIVSGEFVGKKCC